MGHMWHMTAIPLCRFVGAFNETCVYFRYMHDSEVTLRGDDGSWGVRSLGIATT